VLKKIVYLCVLGFCFSIIFLPPYSFAQVCDFNTIFINNQLIENVDNLNWITEKSVIMVKNIDGDATLKLEIDPNQKIVDVIYSAFQLNIMVDKLTNEAKKIQLRDKIKKFKINVVKGEKESVSLDVKYENKFEVGVTDFLIVPFVLKLLIKEPLQCMFGNRSNIQICRRLN